ncbi:MAG: hypothetical protein BM564_11880 [Bacteroidetes bacterium MedPE-SWsnd-G2]|nr:MAG: hypothetical protein BM564_11880 [Bacteroidetes bacterium MedPE-SWsnd-G2]
MKNMYCSLFGHDFQISKKVTQHVREFKCTHCNAQMTTNGQGKLIPLTPKFQEINAVLEQINKKRLKRKSELGDFSI